MPLTRVGLAFTPSALAINPTVVIVYDTRIHFSQILRHEIKISVNPGYACISNILVYAASTVTMCDLEACEYYGVTSTQLAKLRSILSKASSIFAFGAEKEASIKELLVEANDVLPDVHHMWLFDTPQLLQQDMDRYYNTQRLQGKMYMSDRLRKVYHAYNLFRADIGHERIDEAAKAYSKEYKVKLRCQNDYIKEICRLENNNVRNFHKKEKCDCGDKHDFGQHGEYCWDA